MILAQRQTVIAVIEDVCNWLTELVPGFEIRIENFLQNLCSGVMLANISKIMDPSHTPKVWDKAVPESFHARDNIAQFLKWSS